VHIDFSLDDHSIAFCMVTAQLAGGVEFLTTGTEDLLGTGRYFFRFVCFSFFFLLASKLRVCKESYAFSLPRSWSSVVPALVSLLTTADSFDQTKHVEELQPIAARLVFQRLSIV